jgi:hypothetical protein
MAERSESLVDTGNQALLAALSWQSDEVRELLQTCRSHPESRTRNACLQTYVQ